MDPNRIDRSYCDAARIDAPADRAAYLERACGGDDHLRRNVEQLLEVRSRADHVLESPPPVQDATVDGPPAAERPGTLIGPYTLLQQIGEGGMGTVFMAVQTEPVQRKVALKLIKAGMDNRQVIARFEAERQALAMMNHGANGGPHVARRRGQTVAVPDGFGGLDPGFNGGVFVG